MSVMAYSAIRWSISGTCFGGTEIWSTGFWTGNDASDIPGTSVSQATVDSVAARWSTFFTAANSSIYSGYKTALVKAAYWHYDVPALKNKEFGTPTYHTYTAPISGGGVSSTPMPPQTALAASLVSGYRSGTASHGRMFLPGVNSPLDSSTGKISPTYVTNLAATFLTFVNGVNTDSVPGGSGKMILVGRGVTPVSLPPHEAKNAYVTGIKIGDVYDTQRRRRNGIRETYTGLGVA